MHRDEQSTVSWVSTIISHVAGIDTFYWPGVAVVFGKEVGLFDVQTESMIKIRCVSAFFTKMQLFLERRWGYLCRQHP